jgi:hypothetical protein
LVENENQTKPCLNCPFQLPKVLFNAYVKETKNLAKLRPRFSQIVPSARA